LPNISPFQYYEELTLSKRSSSKTMTVLEYNSNTRNKSTNKPMHKEFGFIRIHQSDSVRVGKIEFVISHSFGMTEICQGNFNELAIDICCRGDGISRVDSAKPPFVSEIRRFYEIKQDDQGVTHLDCLMEMATSTSPMQTHLVSRLYKQ
jgi:THAP4-like, heme-binding beta-barrel domain